MKSMRTLAVVCIFFAFVVEASEFSAQEELTQDLHTFLDGASRNDPAAHDRFWDADLVYTSSSGERFGKAEIMQGLSESDDAADSAVETIYTAEDIRIRQYGDAAVVAFKLVGTSVGDDSKVYYYLNTGTFVRQDDEWRAVAWQATRVPPSEHKKE